MSFESVMGLSGHTSTLAVSLESVMELASCEVYFQTTDVHLKVTHKFFINVSHAQLDQWINNLERKKQGNVTIKIH